MKKWTLLLPLSMTLLFGLALLRTERHASDCLEQQRICFPYPNYLPYPLWQQTNLHWPALLPPAALGLLPLGFDDHFKKSPTRNALSIAATLCSVFALWFCLGLWIARLRRGRPLATQSKPLRYAVRAVAFLLAPLACLLVYSGIRGGWHGPTMTLAGYFIPLLVLLLALTDLRTLPRALHKTAVRAALAVAMALLYAASSASLASQEQDYLARHAASGFSPPESAASVSFLLPLEPDPATWDALAIHGPALLLAELPALLSNAAPDGTAIRALQSSLVAAWWFTVLTLLPTGYEGSNPLLSALRPLFRALLACAASLALVSWLLAFSHHSPTPGFGLLAGTALPCFALRPAKGAHASGQDPTTTPP
jgi:hypothetical protein